MKTISLVLLCSAVAFAAQIKAPVTKDVAITFANGGGPSSEHRSDYYTTSCCSASNAQYLFVGYSISSFQNLDISSAHLVFAEFLSAMGGQRVVAPGGTLDFVAFDIYNSTSFRETPEYTSYDDEELPSTDQVIGTLNVTVATKQQNAPIDITTAVKDALAAGKSWIYIAFGNAGGYGASVKMAAREANAYASYIKAEYNQGEETCAPCPCGSVSGKRRSGCPVCMECTTEQPVEATPEQTCSECPCGSSSGKRRSGCPVCNVCTTEAPVEATPEPTCAACPCGSETGKRRTGCPVCKVCPTTNVPSTNAPTTIAPTSEPPVQQPSTSAAPSSTPAPGENISGDNNARASNGAVAQTVSIATVAAIAVSLMF